ncbi:MAG: hypothetical protein HYZ54_08185 [Ignavibacteriae bacterium]|nr:hypothetical protein [Ignavibacteriota bacterium]
MKKKIFTTILLTTIFCSSSCVVAFEPSVYASPGIKLGYNFGQSGGFTYGFELSVTSDFGKFPGWLSGIVMDIDFSKNWNKIHLGVESSFGSAGFDIGPTFILEDGKMDTGFSVTPFLGLGLIPYYTITYRRDDVQDIREAGTYLKYPLTIISGTGFKWN